MALTNYTTLQASIIATAMRQGDTDFAAFVPDAITMAEQVMNYGTDDLPAIRCADMEGTSTGTLNAGSIALPTDFLEAREVRVAGYGELKWAQPGWIDDQYPTGSTGTPRYYNIEGSTINVMPTSNDTLQLTYYKRIPDLATNTTNWVLSKYPGLYLYGSLIHCAPFMMDDQRLITWVGLYKGLVNGLQNADTRARFARAIARNSGPTP